MARQRARQQLGMIAVTDLTIEREIVIDAPVDVVWRTITEPDQITRWFADHVELDLRPGGEGVLVFERSATTSAVTAPIVVESVDPPHRFSFRWDHPNGQAPVAGNSLLVEFRLLPEGSERTRLRVIETGLELLGRSDDERASYAADHRNGWMVHLDRLLALFSSTPG